MRKVAAAVVAAMLSYGPVPARDIALPLSPAEQLDLRQTCIDAVRNPSLNPQQVEAYIAHCARLKAKIDAEIAKAEAAEKAKAVPAPEPKP